MKSSIPDELVSPLRRLEEIKSSLYSNDAIYYNYKEHCFEFKLVSSNAEWKDSAILIAQKMKELISDIYISRLRIFDSIKFRTENIVHQSHTTIKDEFGIEEQSLIGTIQVKQHPITNEDKVLWWKRITIELEAYKELLNHLGINIDSAKFPILDEKILNRICNLEIDSGFFLSPESITAFKKLYSDPEIEIDEIKKMVLKIGVKRGIAAYIFSELSRLNICTNIYEIMDLYSIFYSKNTVLSKKSLAPDKTKFLHESNSDKKTLEIKVEIDNALSKMIK